MHDLISDVTCNATFILLMIVKLNTSGALEGSVHTYLPNGKHYSSILQLENS